MPALSAAEHAAAIQEEPRPCDGCDHLARCRRDHLACGDFHAYAESGRLHTGNRHPSRRWYRIVATGKEAVTPEDRLEALRIAMRRGIDIAALATGLDARRISRWLHDTR